MNKINLIHYKFTNRNITKNIHKDFLTSYIVNLESKYVYSVKNIFLIWYGNRNT